ncbi:MAG: DUF11 domain-containing protein, partial [Chloroflexi bacterium]|nr:DUF11 domain-containing protein [Chloroflexota bacterium]
MGTEGSREPEVASPTFRAPRPRARRTGFSVRTSQRRGSTLAILLAFVLVSVFSGPLAPPPVQAAETDADLSVSQFDTPDPVATGDTLTYQVSIWNAGPATATGVTLTDTLPEGATFGTTTPSQGSCGEDSGVVTCDLGSLVAFGSASVDVVVTAPAAVGTITNTAAVSGAEVDPFTEDNTSAEDTDVVAPQADLSIVQSDDPDPVATDDTLTYAISVFNAGPLDATGLTVIDTLPAGVTFDAATPSQGTCEEDNGAVYCYLGSVAAFDSATIDLVVTAPSATGTIANTASVDADQDDLNSDDNTWVEETAVSAPGANLSVSQFDSSDPAPTGTEVTYTVMVGNAGPSDATDVTLTDTLPASSAVSVTPSQGACNIVGGTATCGLESILAGGSASVAVTVTAPSEATTITNTAVVSGSPSDPDTADNESIESTEIRGPCGPAVCIDNGAVLLAVNPEGHLNAPDGSGSPAGPGNVGLMFIPTGNDSTSPGCLCEGWGAADAGTAISGYANISTDGGVNNMELESFESTASTAVSTVNIEDTLRVTHDYHPSGPTPNLYEATVTIQNMTDAALSDIRYRRVMDWDIEPTAFSEFVTVDGGSATNLLFTSNDGFGTANPLGPRSDRGFTGDFVDQGPDDHGALFDFGFAALDAGEALTFNIYYGASATETGALEAINAVGAEVYSLGQPSTEDGPSLGTPNTFVFAFAGVGGDPIFSPIAVDDTLTVQE